MDTTTTDSPRELVFVTAAMRDAYYSERREIDARYQALSEAPEGVSLVEHWATLAMLRQSARVELRRTLREAVRHGFGGIYPVPV